jgi:hypothetical protein
MPSSELAIIPGGETVVDVLVEAYNGKRWPNEFQKSYGKPRKQPTEAGELIRRRVADVPFSAYWGERFEEFHSLFNNPLGFFAVKVFDKAKVAADDEEFQRSVGAELGSHFPESVLEAALDIPGLQNVLLEVPRLGSLATFLREQRDLLGADRLYPIEPISDSWLQFTHALTVEDTWTHYEALGSVTSSYVTAGREAAAAIEEFASVGGETAGFVLPDRLYTSIARSLGGHFPELVIAHLLETPPEGSGRAALGATITPALPRTTS